MKLPTEPLTLDMLIEQLSKLREDMSGDTEILIPDAPGLKRPVANAAWLDVIPSGIGTYVVPETIAKRDEKQLAIVIN